jgi:hypothetical protein
MELRKKTDMLVIHCAATKATMDIGYKEIRKWHVEDRGWDDVGYHYIIRRDGKVEVGRPEGFQGAHAQAVIQNNQQGWKDEFVLILVSAPVMLLIWSIFSDDPEIMQKVDMFFDKFNNMPFWYQALFIGVVSAIYGLKGADIIKKK